MLICPECRSTDIIWDYRNGYIICTNCGLVLDRIYVKCIDRKKNEINNRKLISEVFGERKRKQEYYKKNNRVRRITRIINEIKSRPYLTLDTNAVNEYLLGKRPHVKLFKYKTWAPNNDLILKQIIEKVVNNDPVLASRTERAKWAIAKILVQLSTNKSVDVKSIANETKLSVTHIRRLISVIQKRKSPIMIVHNMLQKGIK